MKVNRILSNTATSEINKAKAFYEDILGLELLMDHGWFQTYGSEAKMTVQVSLGSEGGAGTPVPDLSIEVDDVQAALTRFKEANVSIEYGPVSEPWGVRRFYVRDPFGKLINILQHESTNAADKALQPTHDPNRADSRASGLDSKDQIQGIARCRSSGL